MYFKKNDHGSGQGSVTVFNASRGWFRRFMNETACWFDMPFDTTGAKVVHVKTTGHEKDHFTVVLTIIKSR